MPPRIQILPENLCNQIAAGEVVERPSSVVKELLENSLDAGATSVQIDLERGGKSLVRVADDGSGMNREDLLLCLERHATSKIRQDADLFQLTTLGFRGEALPSIAAVSRLQISSRVEESEEGWEVRVEAGRVRGVEAVGRPRGTEIEVRDMFFRLPARKKFLRRDETELGHISETVTRQALARPEVQFQLRHQGRTLLDLPRHPRPEERIGALLGRPVLRQLLPLDFEAPWGKLHGFLSEPALTRSAPNAVYTYINGRFIRDRLVQHALLEGYRNIIPKGRYPVTVLFLDMAPEQVDVNVHPTKHEVRFRDPQGVHELVATAIRQALSRPGCGDSGAIPDPATPLRVPSSSPVATVPAAQEARRGVQEALAGYAARLDRSVPPPPAPNFAFPAAPFPERRASEPDEARFADNSYFQRFHLIGQYRGSYLLCQEGDDLVLIDQHAAHERIGFERLKAQVGTSGIEKQALLFPLVLELGAVEFASFSEKLARLESLGFELEEFGQRAFAIKAVPQLLQQVDAEALLRDVAGELAAIGSSELVDEALDRVLMTMACHTMVRANQVLGREQMLALLRDLDSIDFSSRCPHGRPVFARLTQADVEKLFHRR